MKAFRLELEPEVEATFAVCALSDREPPVPDPADVLFQALVFPKEVIFDTWTPPT